MLSLSRYPDVSVPAPMANITAVLRPEITRVKELAMLVRSQLLSGKSADDKGYSSRTSKL